MRMGGFDPVVGFLILLAIGAAVGLLAERFMPRSWLTKQLGPGRRAQVTAALIGIAGALAGFQIAALAHLSAGAYGPFVAAAVGAAVVVWLWRMVK